MTAPHRSEPVIAGLRAHTRERAAFNSSHARALQPRPRTFSTRAFPPILAMQQVLGEVVKIIEQGGLGDPDAPDLVMDPMATALDPRDRRKQLRIGTVSLSIPSSGSANSSALPFSRASVGIVHVPSVAISCQRMRSRGAAFRARLESGATPCAKTFRANQGLSERGCNTG